VVALWVRCSMDVTLDLCIAAANIPWEVGRVSASDPLTGPDGWELSIRRAVSRLWLLPRLQLPVCRASSASFPACRCFGAGFWSLERTSTSLLWSERAALGKNVRETLYQKESLSFPPPALPNLTQCSERACRSSWTCHEGATSTLLLPHVCV
jgi:hypothetical protein